MVFLKLIRPQKPWRNDALVLGTYFERILSGLCVYQQARLADVLAASRRGPEWFLLTFTLQGHYRVSSVDSGQGYQEGAV